MTGSFDKIYTRPIIVDEDKLRYLSAMVEEKFGEVDYGIETIDGIQYKYGKLDDLLSYKNPDSRKIIKISIKGNKYKDGSSSLPELFMTIDDRSKSVLSCYMQLRYLDESDIMFFKNRMDDFVKDYSVWYWWMYKPFSLFALYCLLYTVINVFFSWYVNKEYGLDINHNIIWMASWMLICIGVTVFLIKRVLGYLIPGGGFLIGDQIKAMERRMTVRKWILGLITTVISGLIVGKLIK